MPRPTDGSTRKRTRTLKGGFRGPWRNPSLTRCYGPTNMVGCSWEVVLSWCTVWGREDWYMMKKLWLGRFCRSFQCRCCSCHTQQVDQVRARERGMDIWPKLQLWLLFCSFYYFNHSFYHLLCRNHVQSSKKSHFSNFLTHNLKNLKKTCKTWYKKSKIAQINPQTPKWPKRDAHVSPPRWNHKL